MFSTGISLLDQQRITPSIRSIYSPSSQNALSSSTAKDTPTRNPIASNNNSTKEARESVEMEGNTAFKQTIVLTPVASDIALAAAEAESLKNDCEVTICVCDAGGVPIQVKRNTFPASYEIAVGKAKTAALFGKSTGTLSDEILEESTARRESLENSPFVLSKGGVPLKIDGAICGGVGVSGAMPEQNEQIAQAGVAALADLIWSKRVFEAEQQAELLTSKQREPDQAEAPPKKGFSMGIVDNFNLSKQPDSGQTPKKRFSIGLVDTFTQSKNQEGS
mmetsp:Transcript_22303/g.33714  ORF Transcript_22303/g.33714 Transcript_22303/m.33714 type:complete len:277 (-) Transcript_22303:188-1018(-)